METLRDTAAEFEFDVFISFRHRDGRNTARSVRRWLKNWQPPMQTERQDRLRIFVDSFQGRATRDYWEDTIRPALVNSRWLVVVVTESVLKPLDDGSPNWVTREIETFLDTPQAGNLIPVLAESHRSGPLPELISRRFPRIQIFDLGIDDPLAPRLPLIETRHVFTYLGIGAAIRGIDGKGLEELRQEERRRQVRRLAVTGTGVAAVLGVVVVLAVIAIVNGVEAIRSTAQTALRQAAEESTTRPDRAALLAAYALQTASEPMVLNWFLGGEKQWARELLGTVSLPRSVIRVPGGRIDEIAVTGDGETVVALTEDRKIAAYRAPDWATLWSRDLPVDGGRFEMHLARDHVFLSSYATERVLGYDLTGTKVADLSLPADWSGGMLLLTESGFVVQWDRTSGMLSLLDPLEAKRSRSLWETGPFDLLETASHVPDREALLIVTRTREVGVYAEHLLDARDGSPRSGPALRAGMDPTPRLVSSGGFGLRVVENGAISRYSLEDGAEQARMRFGAVSLYASDRSPLAAASTGWRDSRVVVFDAESGNLLRQPIGPVTLWSGPVFDAEGRRMALMGEGAVYVVDDVEGGESVVLHVPGQIMSGTFLDDENLFALADREGRVSVWDLRSARPVLTGIMHEEGSVKLATAAGGTLVSGGWDGTLRFTRTDTELEPVWQVATGSPVLAIDIDAAGERFAYTGDGLVGLCTFETRQCEEYAVAQPVNVAFFGPDAALFVERADNAGAVVVRPETGPVPVSDGPSASAHRSDLVVGVNTDGDLQFHRGDGSVIKCRGKRGTDDLVKIRVAAEGSHVLLFAITGVRHRMRAVSDKDCSALWPTDRDWIELDFTELLTVAIDGASGTAFVSGGGGGILVSLTDGALIREIEDRHVFNDVAWSSDGRTLYLAAMSREVSAQNVVDGSNSFETLRLDSLPWAIDLSASGDRLAIANFADRHGRYLLQVIDAREGEVLAVVPHPTNLFDVLFGPDGTIITAAEDGVIRAWPLAPDDRHHDTIMVDVSSRTARRVERNGIIVSSPVEHAPAEDDRASKAQ